MTMAEPLVIIRMDGGICSQICFAALGRWFARNGAAVRYDLEWFRKYGRDLDGLHPRPFELPLAFPSLDFPEASPEEIRLYAERHYRNGRPLDQCRPPVYIDGYPEEQQRILLELRGLFQQAFQPTDLAEIGELLAQIAERPACAVHIRRGDLAEYCGPYGAPPRAEYFRQAMQCASTQLPGARFFLFSDEPAWVQRELLPRLAPHPCTVVQHQDATRGHLDLYAISRCQAIIASQGSFGATAKILAPRNPTLIVPREYPLLGQELGGVRLIADPETVPNSRPAPSRLQRLFSIRRHRGGLLLTILGRRLFLHR
jgi:hypothetical protein